MRSAIAADTIQEFNGNFAPPAANPYLASRNTLPVAGALPGVPDPSTNFMRITTDGIGTLGGLHFDAFPGNTGPYESLFLDFDVNINDPATGADGMGIVYLDTGMHGVSGRGPDFSEDANVAGSLGIGLDTWNNGGGDGLAGTGSLPDTFSLHFNGATLSNVPMATLGLPDDWLENGVSKHVTIAVTPAVSPATGMDVSMSVSEYGGLAVTPFVAVNIPTMTPYNGRWSFRGRTGGENQNQDVDNLVTTFDPDGAAAPIVTTVSDFVPPGTTVGGTPFASMQHGAPVPPTIVQDAPGGGALPGHMQLSTEGINISNSIAFDKTSDNKQQILADFDIRINDTGDVGSADGAAFMLLDTAVYGDSGPIPGGFITFEEPNLAGALGLGLDTFSAGPGSPDSCADCVGNTGNAIRLAFNGTQLGIVSFPQSEIDLVGSAFHHMTVLTQEVPGGMNVSVAIIDGLDGSIHTPFTDFFIASTFAGSVRAAFGVRTGGAADFVDVDNVNVAFIPEPSSVVLAIAAAVAGLGVAYRRRRAG
jgi:hypothetical protein